MCADEDLSIPESFLLLKVSDQVISSRVSSFCIVCSLGGLLLNFVWVNSPSLARDSCVEGGRLEASRPGLVQGGDPCDRKGRGAGQRFNGRVPSLILCSLENSANGFLLLLWF